MDSNRRATDTGDWRNQLQADSRQRIVSKLMDALTRLLSSSGQEGSQELEKIALRFEEKTYTAATSRSDYLRKISMKIMTMETKLQNPLQSNGANTGHNSSHQVHGMQTEVQNPQPVPQQHLPQQSNPIQGEPKLLYQSQRLAEASSNSLNSTAQANGGDWQEEVYQKIKSIKDMYFVDLNDVLMKISSILQQRDSQPQQPRSEPLEKVWNFKVVLESLVGFLRINRSEIQGYHRDKWPAVERQIIHILNSNWSRRKGPLQGQLPQPQMSVVRIEDNQMNPQMQPMNLRSSISMQPISSSQQNMVDRTASGNESRAAVGEDLVAMTKCRLRARNSFTQDEPYGRKRTRHSTSAIPSNVVSSVSSLHDSVKQLNGCDAFELESNATSSIQRSRIEPNHALIEEIGEINRRLIGTVVEISEAEGVGGIIVKCSFSAVALSPNLKAQYASAQMSPIQPLRLLIPTNYPNSSPILLDEFPVAASKEYEYLSMKVKSKFGNSLTTLSQPMSLSEMARTWDVCARAVVSEFAQQNGGGTFSSKYGTWESCLTTA